MSYPWKVVDVKVVEYPVLLVSFHDGVKGLVKVEPSRMQGIFSVLRDPEFFKQVSWDEGYVTWPGELDIAPDAMHDQLEAHGEWILT